MVVLRSLLLLSCFLSICICELVSNSSDAFSTRDDDIRRMTKRKLDKKFAKSVLKIENSVLLAAAHFRKYNPDPDVDPDLNRNTLQLISSRGFIPEVYEVVTKDGYILKLHRIVNPFNPNPRPRPILMVHGIFVSGSMFITNTPGGDACYPRRLSESFNMTVGNNLGFEMANFGFDVWLANFRGTRYSLGHVSLDPRQDRSYWNFSFDEIAAYDVPAFINKVRKVTGYHQISYIGHSLGSTSLFSLFSIAPQYEEVIKPFVAMSPQLRGLSFQTSLRFAALKPAFHKILRKVGGPINFPPASFGQLINSACTYPMRGLCILPVFLGSGFSWDQLNFTRLPVYVNNYDTISVREVAHALQLAKQQKWTMFSYGKRKNMQYYGQKKAPAYRFDKINHRYTALIYSLGDYVSDPDGFMKDFQVPLLVDYMIPNKHFNHLDYFQAKDSGLLVNTKIAQIFSWLFGDNGVEWGPGDEEPDEWKSASSSNNLINSPLHQTSLVGNAH